MKNSFRLFTVTLFFLISVSCEETDCMGVNTDPCSSQTVKEVSNELGFVAYHEGESKWMIVHSIAGTFDSQDLGLICDSLPKEFQQIGTRVLFSGEYKSYDKDTRPPLSGQTFYYLRIYTIENEEL